MDQKVEECVKCGERSQIMWKYEVERVFNNLLSNMECVMICSKWRS